MSKCKKPDYFKVPNLPRLKLIEWILDQPDSDRGGRDYSWAMQGNRYTHSDGMWPFCWNVKLHGLDLDFENLIKRAAEMDCLPRNLTDPVVRQAYQDKYDECNKDHLYEWGVEDAQRWVVGRTRDGQPDDDGWNQLWDGTPVDVRLMFAGRSGGWLVLTWFQGHLMNREHTGESRTDRIPREEQFGGWSHKELRQLAEYCLWIKHCTKNPGAEVERQAAFNFFVNYCSDVDDEIRERRETNKAVEAARELCQVE